MSRRRPLAFVGEYDSHEALMADVDILRDAGIEPVASGLMDPEGGWRLEVDAHVVTEALIALGRGGPPDPDVADYACPRCGSPRSVALPPYVLIGLVLSFALSTGLMSLQQWRWLAVATITCGYALHRLEQAPHWRCLSCDHRWNHQAAAERRAQGRRTAPE